MSLQIVGVRREALLSQGQIGQRALDGLLIDPIFHDRVRVRILVRCAAAAKVKVFSESNSFCCDRVVVQYCKDYFFHLGL